MNESKFISRKNPRVKSDINAEFRSQSRESGSFSQGIITNFSRSGLFIASETVFQAGTLIELRVYLDETEHVVTLKGTVVTRKADPEKGMGVAIDIGFISETDKIKLKEFFDLNHIYGWFC
ncbi:MAG: PilZ domain-containing protein [Spirochaetales bacterium]|nr:PilZ domain-containing protein [Spirochaetales bacterium]